MRYALEVGYGLMRWLYLMVKGEPVLWGYPQHRFFIAFSLFGFLLLSVDQIAPLVFR